MLTFLKALFRHFRVPSLGALVMANAVTAIPFLAALVGPILLASNLALGMVVLIGGFLVTGQTLAVSGRVLDARFLGKKPVKGAVLSAWGQSWAEGLVMAAVLLGLFSLAFNSLPFYWSQGTAFSAFSLVMLAVGTILVLGGLPYYLPVRRREGLSLVASVVRSFRLMNSRPGLSLATLALGLFSLLVNVGTLGLFPGFGGLAALHQGAYDAAVGNEEEPR